jgi:hypothetical protein
MFPHGNLHFEEAGGEKRQPPLASETAGIVSLAATPN